MRTGSRPYSRKPSPRERFTGGKYAQVVGDPKDATGLQAAMRRFIEHKAVLGSTEAGLFSAERYIRDFIIWADERSVTHPQHVTYMELAQGCRDKAELARLKKGLAARQAEVLQITPAISQRAADMIDTLALSHGMRLADALIGATAIEHGLTLLSANAKHFSAVKDLKLDAFLP